MKLLARGYSTEILLMKTSNQDTTAKIKRNNIIILTRLLLTNRQLGKIVLMAYISFRFLIKGMDKVENAILI